MEDRKFKTGDHVILVSDTDQVPMTVRQYVADYKQSISLDKSMVDGFLVCDWRDSLSKPHQKQYKEDELKLIV